VALPLKLKNCSGSPVRALAIMVWMNHKSIQQQRKILKSVELIPQNRYWSR
jgi:hypothetical protein